MVFARRRLVLERLADQLAVLARLGGDNRLQHNYEGDLVLHRRNQGMGIVRSDSAARCRPPIRQYVADFGQALRFRRVVKFQRRNNGLHVEFSR
jgi:hypothetical protein